MAAPDKDNLWIEFKKNKNSKAFKALFDETYEPLCRYAFVFLKDRWDSEEIVLDFFIHIWNNRHKIEISHSVDSYFFRSVRNRCLNFLRSSRPGVSLDETMIWELPPDLSRIDMEDLSEIVREAVTSLPPKCKEVFFKSRMTDLSNEEISKDMGISEKTVEAHITKALKVLRTKIKKLYIFFL